jgi:hypothetical protein
VSRFSNFSAEFLKRIFRVFQHSRIFSKKISLAGLTPFILKEFSCIWTGDTTFRMGEGGVKYFTVKLFFYLTY